MVNCITVYDRGVNCTYNIVLCVENNIMSDYIHKGHTCVEGYECKPKATVVWLNAKAQSMNIMSAEPDKVHLVDIMFPCQTKSLFNEFMKKAFPRENTASYIMEWWYRFFGHDVSREPSVNFMFMHDDDCNKAGISSVYYPQCKMDYDKTDIYFDLVIGRLEALRDEHNKSRDRHIERSRPTKHKVDRLGKEIKSISTQVDAPTQQETEEFKEFMDMVEEKEQ